MSLTSLPEPVLHLICALLSPSRALTNDHQPDTIPSLHRSIINLALTCRFISRFAKSHIATNICLANHCLRSDLFLRTVLESPTYASNIQYLKLLEGPYKEQFQSRSTEYPEFEQITPLLTALHQLQVLHIAKGRSLDPDSIIRRLTDGPEEMPMRHTLEEFRFDHVNQWGEEKVVRVKLCRDAGQGHGRDHSGVESLTGSLQGLILNKFLDWSEVQATRVTGVDCDQKEDGESDGDWVDEDEEDSWDDEYEEDSSDYDSEDSSDYEDDWEAEGGLGLGGIVDVPAPAKVSTRHF